MYNSIKPRFVLTGEPMNDSISDQALILVAILPETRDLEIARLLGWYRIPLRFAPKVVDVDYLAFYQPSAFGKEHGGCIEWFSEVRGHELTLRRELFRDQPDHPRANEEYYKIQLGPLQRLEKPIQADRWRRMTFLYSTGELLRKAHSFQDLVVRTDERNLLWRSLRERAVNAGAYRADLLPELDLPEDLLLLLGGCESMQ